MNKQSQPTKVALVYDRVNKFGGAERILLDLHNLFPKAPLYTLVFEPNSAYWAKNIKVIVSFFNRLPFLRSHHELLTPLASLGFESFNFDRYDLVISVTSSDAKAIVTKPQTLHICYCLTPPRYLWSLSKTYRDKPGFGWLDPVARSVFAFLKKRLQKYDRLIANRPDFYLSISKTVSRRIKKIYGRSAEMIYPGIDKKFFELKLIDVRKREYHLYVGRLVPYKKTDLVVAAFNQLGLPLVIVGSGSETKKLKQMAGDNVTFAGQVSDQRLIEYYRYAKALIFPQVEDFGLVPLEAQACGTPVIAFNRGGAKETVISGKTGIIFTHQTASAIIKAVKRLQTANLDPKGCRENAQKFTQQKFINNFSQKLDKIWTKQQGR